MQVIFRCRCLILVRCDHTIDACNRETLAELITAARTQLAGADLKELIKVLGDITGASRVTEQRYERNPFFTRVVSSFLRA